MLIMNTKKVDRPLRVAQLNALAINALLTHLLRLPMYNLVHWENSNEWKLRCLIESSTDVHTASTLLFLLREMARSSGCTSIAVRFSRNAKSEGSLRGIPTRRDIGIPTYVSVTAIPFQWEPFPFDFENWLVSQTAAYKASPSKGRTKL